MGMVVDWQRCLRHQRERCLRELAEAREAGDAATAATTDTTTIVIATTTTTTTTIVSTTMPTTMPMSTTTTASPLALALGPAWRVPECVRTSEADAQIGPTLAEVPGML